MKNTIRSELYKALTNKMLYIAMAIGLAFWTMDVLENGKMMAYFDENLEWAVNSGLRVGTGHEGYSLFFLWSGLAPQTKGANLFYTVWPVLAAMAYGWSYSDERRSGVYNQIAARTSAKTYYISKYIAVFVSGGMAVAVPVLLGLLGNAMFVPHAIVLQGLGAVRNNNFLSELYYTIPWAYGLIWCGVTFLCGGAAACLCFTVGTKLRYGVMVMLTPYAIYVALDALTNSLRTSVLHDVVLVLSPLRLAWSTPGWANPEWWVFMMLGMLTAFSFGVGYWQVVKHELA